MTQESITRRGFAQAVATAGAAFGRQTKNWTPIAHRGAVSGEAVENTAAALEAAIRDGYWRAEIDLCSTNDRQMILNHDADFSRV
jgi:glycerophosphoryl diester phosphodiesterase